MTERMEVDDIVTRESILKMMETKDEIMKELKEMKELLDLNHIGMTEDLVDGEGYPRNDIDVYQVRHARHRIICLQNDYKSIMNDIEKGLHALHAQSRQTTDEPSVPATSRSRAIEVPIVRVNFVHPDSPAATAGMLLNDVILQFGTITAANFTSLQDIGTLVQHSVGRKIHVRVKRNEAIVNLTLIPKEWSGKGLLGCNILPIENIDR